MSTSIFTQFQSEMNRYPRVFTAARVRIARLAGYPDAAALLAALGRGSPLDPEEKCDLLSVLVGEAQRSRHPLWASTLVAAFAPMLNRIRRKTLPSPGESPEDTDQRVVLAFLEAVQKIRPGFPISGLRWATERLAWKALPKDEPELVFDDSPDPNEQDGEADEEEEREPPCENPFAEEDRMLDRIAARDIARSLEERGQSELLEVLVCSGDDSDTLSDYVARTYPGLSKCDRSTAYSRLRAERDRVVRKIRKGLASRAA